MCFIGQNGPCPPLTPPKTRHSSGEALGEPVGGSGGALGELWELWEALAELREALGELWEDLYIRKLPINRPSGRYVKFFPERRGA